MARRARSLNDRFTRWQVLVNNLKQTGIIPYVAEDLSSLEELLAKVRSHQNRLQHYRAQSQELTNVIRSLASEGDEIRRRIGAHLHGEVGFRNEELIRYGFKPRRAAVRRKKDDQATVEKDGPPAAAAAPQDQSSEGASD